MKNDISNSYTLTEDSTGDKRHIIVNTEFAKGVKITLEKANNWERNADGSWPDSKQEIPFEYSEAYITGITNNYKKASIDVVKVYSYSSDKKPHGDGYGTY